MSAAPAGPTAPTGPRNYSEFYGHEERDPYAGDYAALMAQFRTNNNAPPGEALRNLVGNSDTSYPAAFLGLYKDEVGEARYRVIHAVARFPRMIGRATAWDDMQFGFAGDVFEGSATTVAVPANAFDFHRGQMLRENVPSNLTRARELLDQSPDEDFLGPFADEDAGIKQAITRTLVPLPHRYVRLLLDRQPRAREGFIDLASVILANGDEVACAPLVDWLLLSIVREQATAAPRVAQDPLVAPVADRALLSHRRDLMRKHLPGLDNGSTSGPLLATQQLLASHVSNMVDEQRLARDEATARAAQARAPKTVAAALGAETAQTLLAICGVTEESDLPPFWAALAAAGKRDRQALEQALLGKARSLGMAEAAPVATPDLTKKVSGLQWAGLNSEDLAEGIQPFTIVLTDYTGSDAGIEAKRLADTYDIMTEGTTSSSLEDAKTLKSSKEVIPIDLSEARAHLVSLMILWSTLLGDGHPFVTAYGTFVRNYMSREYSYQTRLRNLGSTAPISAVFLRFVQLRTVHYWRRALSQRALPNAPEFDQVLEKLDLQDKSWIPALPHKYWKPLEKPPAPAAPALGSGEDLRDILSSLGWGQGPPSMSGTSASGSSAATGASGKGTKKTGEQTPANNPSVSKIFDPFIPKVIRLTIRDAITKGGPPPVVTRNGQELPMCLSYHLKGTCWSGCSRRHDHGAHSDEEDALLLNWCQAAYA